jgi:hypothetical protein
MTTQAAPPWREPDALASAFMDAHTELTSAVDRGTVVLTQFAAHGNASFMMRELQWRHFIVFWSTRLALRAPMKTHTLVECGVCDGITVHFALRAAPESAAYLYDAWGSADKYQYLSLDQTRRNLAAFTARTQFIQGLIPDSLRLGSPASCEWLHIDLNAAEPTHAALQAFYDRIPSGGVVLFDDYGWPDHLETKRTVDQFFADKRGQLLPFPTGQALWLKD